MTTPEFPTVFRGYDPAQVDQHVASLQAALEAAQREVAHVTVELTKTQQAHTSLAEEVKAHQVTIASLEEESKRVASPSFTDLGARIGQMLSLADEEAAQIRSTAASIPFISQGEWSCSCEG